MDINSIAERVASRRADSHCIVVLAFDKDSPPDKDWFGRDSALDRGSPVDRDSVPDMGSAPGMDSALGMGSAPDTGSDTASMVNCMRRGNSDWAADRCLPVVH